MKNQELGPCEQLGRPEFELLYQILSRTKNKTRGGFSMIRNGREVSGKGAGSIQVLMRSAGLVPGGVTRSSEIRPAGLGPPGIWTPGLWDSPSVCV